MPVAQTRLLHGGRKPGVERRRQVDAARVDRAADARLEIEPIAAEIQLPGNPGGRVVGPAQRVDADDGVYPRLPDHRQLIEGSGTDPEHNVLAVLEMAAMRYAVHDVVLVDPQHRLAGQSLGGGE